MGHHNSPRARFEACPHCGKHGRVVFSDGTVSEEVYNPRDLTRELMRAFRAGLMAYEEGFEVIDQMAQLFLRPAPPSVLVIKVCGKHGTFPTVVVMSGDIVEVSENEEEDAKPFESNANSNDYRDDYGVTLN